VRWMAKYRYLGRTRPFGSNVFLTTSLRRKTLPVRTHARDINTSWLVVVRLSDLQLRPWGRLGVMESFLVLASCLRLAWYAVFIMMSYSIQRLMIGTTDINNMGTQTIQQ
jgi:hypothetical protein